MRKEIEGSGKEEKDMEGREVEGEMNAEKEGRRKQGSNQGNADNSISFRKTKVYLRY